MQISDQSDLLEELSEIKSRVKAYEKLQDEQFVTNLIKFINQDEVIFSVIENNHYEALIYLLPLTTKVLKTIVKLDKFSKKDIKDTINRVLISSIDTIIDLDNEESIDDNFLDNINKFKEKLLEDTSYYKEELEDEKDRIDRLKQTRKDIQSNDTINTKLREIDQILNDINQLIPKA